MTRWRFLDVDLALILHEEALAAHGGAIGLMSEAALEQALMRPRELARAAPRADAARLAAATAAGFIRAHPFVHGKRRVALLAMEMFLVENGWRFSASDEECFILISQFANREIDEEALADCLRAYMTPAE